LINQDGYLKDEPQMTGAATKQSMLDSLDELMSIMDTADLNPFCEKLTEQETSAKHLISSLQSTVKQFETYSDSVMKAKVAVEKMRQKLEDKRAKQLQKAADRTASVELPKGVTKDDPVIFKTMLKFDRSREMPILNPAGVEIFP
jgi:hypothetical protein